ncbi:MAG: hypothetical protein NVS1B3_12330 [Candidatus Dormibacteraceae bacterium]
MQARHAWVWPLVAVVGVAVTIYPRSRWINIYEDQAVLAGEAMQVAAGQVPYRDFFAGIPPGAIFMYAGYFKVVGATVVNQRVLTGVAMVLGVGLVAHLGRRLAGSIWAAAIALLWGVWLPVFQEFSPYHFWSVMFALAMAGALLAAREIRAAGRRPVRSFALAGLAASAALIMLQSSLPVVMAGFVVAWLIEPRIKQSVLPMSVAMVAPGALILAVLGLLGAIPALVIDVVLYPLQKFGGSQALPFPWQPALLHDTSFWEASIGALWAIPMHWLLAVIAPIGIAASTAVTLWRLRRAPAELPDWALLGILAVGLYTCVLIVHMSDQNFWLSSPLTLLLVAVPLKRMLARLGASRLTALAAGAPVALIYLTGLSPLVLGYALVCHADGTGFLREVSTPRGSICTTFDSAPIVAGSLKFMAQHKEAIAFMPTAPSMYQITGLVPQVPILFLVPGVTPPAELARTEASMRRVPVEWVIYYKVDFSKDLPAVRELQNGSRSSFDLFLDEAYQRDDQEGLILYRLKH